jgi:hypothetical protein
VTGDFDRVLACIGMRGSEDRYHAFINDITFCVDDISIVDGIGSDGVAAYGTDDADGIKRFGAADSYDAESSAWSCC